LKADQAFSVNNYVHFRAPLLKKNIDLNARREGIYNNDFLDNAEEDKPVGTWSIQRHSWKLRHLEEQIMAWILRFPQDE